MKIDTIDLRDEIEFLKSQGNELTFILHTGDIWHCQLIRGKEISHTATHPVFKIAVHGLYEMIIRYNHANPGYRKT